MKMLSPLWTSGALASDLFRDWDRMIKTYEDRGFAPATDVVETDKSYTLSMDLPGLKKEDIKIEVLDNVLNVSGERKNEISHEDNQSYRVEKSYGSFRRSFTLPRIVSPDGIEAHYENGVLNLTLPKTQLAQSKKIEIQTKEKDRKLL